MTHPRSSSTTVVAILGTAALSEDILARLLEREGYSVKSLEASYATHLLNEPLDGVDVVLFCPGLNEEVRAAFLEGINTTRKTASIPVLRLSGALEHALLDELSANLSWRHLFGELVKQIQGALEAVSAKALELDAGEPV